MKTTLYTNQSKTFLSDAPDEFSNIAWSVSLQSAGPNNSWIWSEIRMGDCNKTITLSMGLTVQCEEGLTEEDRVLNKDLRLSKIDRLIHELEQYRAAYLSAIEQGEALSKSV